MISKAEIENTLKNNLLFQEFTDKQFSEIIPLFREMMVEPGSFILHQGDLGHELYVIQSGMVEVLKKVGSRDNMVRLATLQEGDNFGEMSLVDNDYRTASVRALKPTTLLAVSTMDAHTLPNHPEIFSHLYKGLIQQLNSRLRFMNEAVAKVMGNEELHNQKAFFMNGFIGAIVVVLLIFAFFVGNMIGKGRESLQRSTPDQEIIIQ